MNIDILNITTFAETPQLRTVVDLFDIANAVATILIGLVGFIISRSVKHRNDRELRAERRALIKDACAGVDMEFAIGLFQDQTYAHDARTRIEFGQLQPPERGKAPKIPEKTTVPDRGPLKRYDWEAIFGRSQPFEAWHRHARSAALVFFETLRPCAHLIGGEHGTLGLQNPRVDPACFRLRLTLQALAMYWDPKSTRANELSQEEIEARRDNCTDAIKAFVKDAYADGDEMEWAAFLRMCEAFVPGRFAAVPKAAGRPTATEML